jgi:hypothetical protein
MLLLWSLSLSSLLLVLRGGIQFGKDVSGGIHEHTTSGNLTVVTGITIGFVGLDIGQ